LGKKRVRLGRVRDKVLKEKGERDLKEGREKPFLKFNKNIYLISSTFIL